jgi:predicted RecA/RadA family phage recombinase
MGISILMSEIERSSQFIFTGLTASQSILAGDMLVIGANCLASMVEKAKGATLRTAERAAGTLVAPDRSTALVTAEDLVLPKTPGLDAIAVGTKVWWDTTTKKLISALSQVTTDTNYACGFTVRLSDDTADTVAINFDGRNTVAENGTGS